MPKMVHYAVPETIDVADEKVAVYEAQGWVSADAPAADDSPAMTRASANPPKKAAKKAPAKKATKKKS